jgi:acyl-CoA reductase-like NAD-dependent aldehyde dehydrogenase
LRKDAGVDETLSIGRHWIGGGWEDSADLASAESLDPADGSSIGSFAAGGATEAESAVAAAREAFDASPWAQSPRLRQDVLLAWASHLEADHAALARLLTRENGKVLRQAEGEIAAAVSEIRYFAGQARAIRGSAQEVAPGVFSTIYREPAGVAGIIVPWNGPVLLLIRSLAPALAAGCTAVVKPAAQTALVTVRVLGHLAAVSLLPKAVVQLVLETGSAAAEHLVASDKVDVISFTGSTAVGERIMAAAAPTLKKLSLELGGKACCLVFEDADIAAVAPRLAAAATIISGQQCTAARRVMVHRSRLSEMKAALKQALEAIRVGPGLDPASDMGPLIDDRARDTVQRAADAAFEQCDEVLVRAVRPAGLPAAGAWITPGAVVHSDPSAFFCRDEIFGPLIVIEPFESEAEAVGLANDTTFGLAASVWTNDGARAQRVARALRDGTVWINDHNQLFAEAEMGGYRRSGTGRLHGPDAILDFTEQKHIFQSVGTVPPIAQDGGPDGRPGG